MNCNHETLKPGKTYCLLCNNFVKIQLTCNAVENGNFICDNPVVEELDPQHGNHTGLHNPLRYCKIHLCNWIQDDDSCGNYKCGDNLICKKCYIIKNKKNLDIESDICGVFLGSKNNLFVLSDSEVCKNLKSKDKIICKDCYTMRTKRYSDVIYKPKRKKLKK